MKNSPLRILAGPGTGKTFQLLQKIGQLLESGVAPEKILFCTFTRTAADDLRRELDDFDANGASLVCASTVHALCFRILAQNDVLEMTDRVPRPLLDYEQRFLLEDLNNGQFGDIDAIRERLKAFESAWARLQSEEPGWPRDPEDQEFQRQLLDWLKFHSAMLIGELVPVALCYLQEHPDSPERSTFSQILVDEYQDLNVAEQEFIQLISESSQLTIVGDEDQSIYGFKYAHPDGIASFHKQHPATVDETLSFCWRSPTTIVGMANKLISHNQCRTPRALTPHPKNGPGEAHIVQWKSMKEEAKGLAEFIARRVHSDCVKPAQILVLAPRYQFGHGIRDLLRKKEVLACSFFHEEELKKSKAQQAFTLLTLVANPEDSVALRCWCGFGSSNLRRGAWERVRALTAENNTSLVDLLHRIENGQFANPHNRHLISKLHELRDRLKTLAPLQGSKLLDVLFPDNDPDFVDIRAIATGLAPGADAKQLLDLLRRNIAQPELPVDGNCVRVMSFHKSKGLTADLVVIMGCVEELISTPPRDSSEEERNMALEEQRRLFYVAITRARKALVISGIEYLPLRDARPMGVDVNDVNPEQHYVGTRMSHFIRELGPTRPARVFGDQFLSSVK